MKFEFSDPFPIQDVISYTLNVIQAVEAILTYNVTLEHGSEKI